MDPLPERVRLIKVPGELRDVELEVPGWGTEHRKLVLNCRLIDGSAGTIPARWTDLPRRAPQERPLGVVASPAAWLLLGERLEGLRSRRPARATAPRRKRRSRCRDSSPLQTSEALVAAAVWETLPPERHQEVTVQLARLLERLLEAERDE